MEPHEFESGTPGHQTLRDRGESPYRTLHLWGWPASSTHPWRKTVEIGKVRRHLVLSLGLFIVTGGCEGIVPSEVDVRDGCAPPPRTREVGWAGCTKCETNLAPISPSPAAADPESAELEDVADFDAPTPSPPAVSAPTTMQTAVAKRTLSVVEVPDPDAPMRGKIGRGRSFSFEELVEGVGCEGAAWARLADHAFVCLADTKAGPASVRGEGDLFYAKPKAGAVAPQWRSLDDYERESPPVSTLVPHHDYAFVGRKVVRGRAVLLDRSGRLVQESDVQRMFPSAFEGRDFSVRPLTEGHTVGWVTSWPAVPITYDDPIADRPPRLPYHAEVEIARDDVNDGDAWITLAGGGRIDAKALRIWRPEIPRPTGILSEETWLDVELGTQILTVMRGARPVFVTLVSSGRKSPTPRGIFRIGHKVRLDTMASTPGAVDEYEVEAVPYVQYFVGGYALHGAYWHNGFGRPLSHGCVNLSPADAARVFSETSPRLFGGWVEAYETESARGSVVQVRRGDVSPPDRRRDQERVYATPPV